ncbi:Protein TRM32 [Linum perenne]
MDFGEHKLGNRRLLWAMFHRSSDGKKAYRRKHGRRRRIARCCACPRTVSFNDHSEDMEPAAPLLVEGNQSERKVSAIKELMARKKKTSSSDWGKNPIIIIHKTPNPVSPKAAKPTQGLTNKQLSRAISSPQQLKDCLDVLDLFMVNKNNFLDILNDKDAPPPRRQSVSSLLVRQNSTRKPGLRKSGSYPSVNSKSPRFLRPSVLEDKHMEVWSSPKRVANSLAVVKIPDDVDRRAGSISQRVRCFLGGFKGVIRKRILRRVIKKGGNKKKNSRRVSNGEAVERTNSIRVKGDEMVQARRSLSLRESLSRYAPLIEQSSSSGATPWSYRKSKSLRLSEEDKSQMNGNRLKYTFRRRLSMTDLDSICEVKEPISGLTWLESDVRKSDYEEEIEPSSNPNVQNEEEMDCEIENRVVEDQEIASEIPSSENQSSVETVLKNDEVSSLQRDTMKVDSLRFEFERIDDEDFNYVRDILDLSGLLDQDCPATLWHSLDQPLSPLVYKEMEYLLQGENDENSSTHHRLLFDLLNEELLGIFESSLTYFPKPLLQSSQGSRCQPMPKGKRVLEQVWKRISQRRNPETRETSLYDIFCGEMNRGDGWMNIQFECEDVALELEDLIMDQLLDEILC